MFTASLQPFNIVDVVCDCLEVDCEYSPGLFMKVKPHEIYWTDFYPHRKESPTIKVVLEDGERRMDKLLFEKLYQLSENPAEEVFSEPEEKILNLPFTLLEFDEFTIFLSGDLENQDPDTIDFYIERFLSYFKITHFLMPKDDRLYCPLAIPFDFLDHLDISLDLFPEKIVREIVSKCDIIKYYDDPIVVKKVYASFRTVDLGPELTKEFFSLTEDFAKSLGVFNTEDFRWDRHDDFYWSGFIYEYGR